MRTRFLLVTLWLSLSCSAFADSYSRGHYHCESFSEAEKLIKASPASVHSRMGRAHCLFARGRDGDHQEALAILHPVIDRHNNVNAAFMLAEYISFSRPWKNARI